MNRLDSKVVAITGASSGIGAATAVELAARGAAVVLGARRTDRLDSLVARIRAGGGRAEMLFVSPGQSPHSRQETCRSVSRVVTYAVNSALPVGAHHAPAEQCQMRHPIHAPGPPFGWPWPEERQR